MSERSMIARLERRLDAGASGRPASDNGAASNGARRRTDRYEGRLLDVEAMLAEPETPLEWRCDGLAVDGYLTVLAGRGGEGKSWVALGLACGVARGEGTAGISCRQGRALIFDAENGPRLTARRFRAAGVTAKLAVQPVDAGGLRILEDLDWFRETIEAQQAQFVVFDSLRVLSSGAKEGDSDEMEPIITALKQLARETQAAILLIHHRGKGDSDYRGSSVILDQTDLLFTLGRVAGDPEGRRRRRIMTSKCRPEEEPEPRWLAIEADRARGRVFVTAAEPYESDGERPRDWLRDQVLDLLTDRPQPQAQIARTVGRDPKDQSVRRVLRDLEGEQLAERGPQGWVSAGVSLGADTPDTPHRNRSVEPNPGVSTGSVSDTPAEPAQLALADASPAADDQLVHRLIEQGAVEVEP